VGRRPEYFILGITDEYDRLKNLRDVEIYDVDVGPFRGFLVRGTGQRGKVARAQLISTENELDIRFYFYGHGASDDSMVGRILQSLKPA
jgi:hypothetical protein